MRGVHKKQLRIALCASGRRFELLSTDKNPYPTFPRIGFVRGRIQRRIAQCTVSDMRVLGELHIAPNFCHDRSNERVLHSASKKHEKQVLSSATSPRKAKSIAMSMPGLPKTCHNTDRAIEHSWGEFSLRPAH